MTGVAGTPPPLKTLAFTLTFVMRNTRAALVPGAGNETLLKTYDLPDLIAIRNCTPAVSSINSADGPLTGRALSVITIFIVTGV